MNSRNHQIHARRGYKKKFRTIEIIMITETEAKLMFHAFSLSWDKT